MQFQRIKLHQFVLCVEARQTCYTNTGLQTVWKKMLHKKYGKNDCVSFKSEFATRTNREDWSWIHWTKKTNMTFEKRSILSPYDVKLLFETEQS